MKYPSIQFKELYLEPSRNGLNRPTRVRGDGCKMVNMGELFSIDRIADHNMERVPMSERDRQNYLLKKHDLLFARSSLKAEGTGKTSIIWELNEDMTFESHIIRVRLDTVRAYAPYYYYYFNSERGHANVLSLMNQVSAAGIRASELGLLNVPNPPTTHQRKIAAVLSAYDDLIENNTLRIKILEEITQSIYREWFVNFRFPGHESVKIVESEMGMIPEGWETKTLGSVLDTIESGSRPKGGVSSVSGEVPSIGAEHIIGLGKYDYSKDKYVSRSFFESMRKGWVQDKDVLLYKDGAQIGRKTMFQSSFPHSECCINEHVFILRTNQLCTQNYLYFWLDRPDMTQNIKNLNANAAQPGINQAGVKSLPILLPPQELLETFDEVLEPLLGELFNLAKKNNVLRRTRDLLLPRLISGEMDAENLDINTGVPA